MPVPFRLLTVLCLFYFTLLPNTSSASEDQIEQAGDWLQIALPSLAYASTFYKDDDQGRMQFYKSFGTNLAVTHSLKALVKKRRPKGRSVDSFPSGHTSAAFQGAAFIHKRYDKPYWTIPAYLAASFVGYSRIDADKHDTTDVLVGAALGIASSWYFTETWQGFQVTPVAFGNGLAISFRSEW